MTPNLPQQSEALSALEQFIVQNDDLLALESLIGKFNIFDALSIVRAEIRHSNFLAFILDPAESHGQGQLFLKAILMDLLKLSPPPLRPFSPIELDGIDLQGVEVRREWEHIDLLITAKQPPLVLAIENKIDSGEHSEQLSRYRNAVKRKYPAIRPFFVYLTLNAARSTEDDWIPYSYNDIHRVLARTRSANASSIGTDVLVFLDHYLNLIGTRFMNDPKIDELCERIYKNHRHALELIFERYGNFKSGVLAEAEAVLSEDSRWHVFYRTSNVVDFIPKAWMPWFPRVGLDEKEYPQSWFVCRFELYEGQLDFYVEIRRMEDLAKRRAIIEKLIAEGPKFGFKRSGHAVKDSYTRISGRTRVSEWEEDGEPNLEEVRIATKKKLDDLFQKIEGISSVIKPFFSL